jgi:hypothetical protein
LLAPETVTLLESGCAVIVGTVSADGAPHASRGWGITFVSSDPAEARLLLDADDAVARSHLETTGRVAVTGGDVRTLRSIQFKGDAIGIEPASDADRDRADAYIDEFFKAVHVTDHTPLEQLETLRPRDYVVCRVRVVEVYDQTPGPAAGKPLMQDSP